MASNVHSHSNQSLSVSILFEASTCEGLYQAILIPWLAHQTHPGLPHPPRDRSRTIIKYHARLDGAMAAYHGGRLGVCHASIGPWARRRDHFEQVYRGESGRCLAPLVPLDVIASWGDCASQRTTLYRSIHWWAYSRLMRRRVISSKNTHRRVWPWDMASWLAGYK